MSGTDKPTGSPLALRRIIHRLRAPGGCPWDREQTPSSLTRYVLEEAYEVVDAIEDGDPAGIRDELGDLLLQVYLQAEIAEEQGQFDFNDVVRAVSEKLIRRHPHVFAGVQVSGARQVQQNWELLKQAERGGTPSSALDRIPRSAPALSQAQEVQRRFSEAGFDWPTPEGAWDKLEEELGELRDARGDKESFRDELGDVLFTLAKLATDSEIDAELALRGALGRVSSRFYAVEAAASERGTDVAGLGHEAQLELWESAKSEV